MTCFNYYATFEESISFLEELCREGFQVVAEPGLFDAPDAPVFDRVNDELIGILKGAPAHFLTGSFACFPIPFIQLMSGESVGKYTVDLLTQGPLLQGLLARVNPVDGVRTLLPGYLSYQKRYRNPESERWEPASPQVRTAHRKAVALIAKRCAFHKVAGAEIAIGPNARQLVENREAVIEEARVMGAYGG